MNSTNWNGESQEQIWPFHKRCHKSQDIDSEPFALAQTWVRQWRSVVICELLLYIEVLYDLRLHKSTQRSQQTCLVNMNEQQVCVTAHCRFIIVCSNLWNLSKWGAFDLWHARESIGVLSSKLLWIIECALHYLNMRFAEQPNPELLDFPRLGTIINWMDFSAISRTQSKDVTQTIKSSYIRFP